MCLRLLSSASVSRAASSCPLLICSNLSPVITHVVSIKVVCVRIQIRLGKVLLLFQGKQEELNQWTEALVGGLNVFYCDKPQTISKWPVFKRFILLGQRLRDYLLLFLFQSEIFPCGQCPNRPAPTGREILQSDWAVCGRPRERDGLKFGSSCGVEKKVRMEQFGSLPVCACVFVWMRERECMFLCYMSCYTSVKNCLVVIQNTQIGPDL